MLLFLLQSVKQGRLHHDWLVLPGTPVFYQLQRRCCCLPGCGVTTVHRVPPENVIHCFLDAEIGISQFIINPESRAWIGRSNQEMGLIQVSLDDLPVSASFRNVLEPFLDGGHVDNLAHHPYPAQRFQVALGDA